MDEFFEANRELWDSRIETHKNSETYNVKGFLKGRNSLDPIEIEEVGDVTGKSLSRLKLRNLPLTAQVHQLPSHSLPGDRTRGTGYNGKTCPVLPVCCVPSSVMSP